MSLVVTSGAHCDIKTTTVDLNQLGGAVFVSGLQIGVDIQPSARKGTSGTGFAR